MPIAYFHLVLREFGRTRAARAALLEGTGVGEERLSQPGVEVSLGQQLRQLQNAVRMLPPGWALRAGRGFHASSHGPLGVAVLSAPSVAESLAVIERFSHVRVPYYRLHGQREGRRYRSVVEEWVVFGGEERVLLLELFMLSSQSLLESLLGEPLSGALIELPYAPPAYAERYAEVLHAPVRFGRAEACIDMPLEWMDLPSPLADPGMYQASLRELEAQSRRLEGRDYLVAQVERLIAAHGDAGLRLPEAAERLHLSRRTLIRRLREAGTSYRGLLDVHHRERAEALLRERGLDIAEIGYRLGYRDPANFGRACRRWFGMAPGRYRAQRADSR